MLKSATLSRLSTFSWYHMFFPIYRLLEIINSDTIVENWEECNLGDTIDFLPRSCSLFPTGKQRSTVGYHPDRSSSNSLLQTSTNLSVFWPLLTSRRLLIEVGTKVSGRCQWLRAGPTQLHGRLKLSVGGCLLLPSFPCKVILSAVEF